LWSSVTATFTVKPQASRIDLGLMMMSLPRLTRLAIPPEVRFPALGRVDDDARLNAWADTVLTFAFADDNNAANRVHAIDAIKQQRPELCVLADLSLAGYTDHGLAGRGNLLQMFTASLEDLDPQFVLEQPYLLADTGL